MTRLFLRLGIVFGFLSVCFGAFGAHAIESSVSPERMAVYDTAVLYMMFHALALIVFALFKQFNSVTQNWPGICFAIGVPVFSGSLLALVLLDMPKLGMITPIGGLLFLIAWAGFFRVTFN